MTHEHQINKQQEINSLESESSDIAKIKKGEDLVGTSKVVSTWMANHFVTVKYNGCEYTIPVDLPACG